MTCIIMPVGGSTLSVSASLIISDTQPHTNIQTWKRKLINKMNVIWK